MPRSPVFAAAPTTGIDRCALDLAACAALSLLWLDRRRSRTARRTTAPMPTTQGHLRCLRCTGGALGASGLTFGAFGDSSSGTSASLRATGASVLLIETILPPG